MINKFLRQPKLQTTSEGKFDSERIPKVKIILIGYLVNPAQICNAKTGRTCLAQMRAHLPHWFEQPLATLI
jgi:hypothetical protein